MKRIMIDLETMGVTKRAAIMSIGAVAFDVEAGRIVDEWCINVNVQDCLSCGLITDKTTEEFWSRPENAGALASLSVGTVDLKVALSNLRGWVLRDADKEDIEPWANGTSFDLAILEVAYEMVSLPIPWKFFNERDYRTVKRLYHEVPKPGFAGLKHNALDDARFQAEHLMRIFKAAALCP